MDEALLNHVASRMVLFLGLYYNCVTNPLKPAVNFKGAGELGLTLRAKSVVATYDVWTEADNDVSSWVMGIFQDSHSRSSGTSTVWILVNLDHFPSGYIGEAKQECEGLANCLVQSPRNLKVMYTACTDDLDDYLRRGDRVIVCTPFDDDGNYFVFEYYEPKDYRGDSKVSLPEFVGLTHLTPEGDKVCSYAQRMVYMDKPTNPPVNPPIHQKEKPMTKKKKHKPDYVFDEFCNTLSELRVGEENITFRDKEGAKVAVSMDLAYRFIRHSSSVAVMKDLATVICNQTKVSNHCASVVKFDVIGVLNKSSDMTNAWGLIHRLKSSIEACGLDTSFSPMESGECATGLFTVTFAVTAISRVMVLEVYPPYRSRIDGGDPVVIVVVDLKTMGCLYATLEQTEEDPLQDTPPWEDVPTPISSSQNWINNNPKLTTKVGTLFLIEQKREDDRGRIEKIDDRLKRVFKSVSISVFAELVMDAKFSDRAPLMQRVRDTLLQGQSVALTWDAHDSTGTMSDLANFVTQTLEWVELARELNAPHYYVGNF